MQTSFAGACTGTGLSVSTLVSGCGSAWLEHLVWDQGGAGSNPVTPINAGICGCSSMVEHQPSKLDTWVRFPSPAPYLLGGQPNIACAPIAQLDRATAF